MTVSLLRRLGNRLAAMFGSGRSSTRTREYRCEDCGATIESTKASKDKVSCHACSSEDVHRLVRYQRTWWQQRDQKVRWLGNVVLFEVAILSLALILEVIGDENPDTLGGPPMMSGLLGALAVMVAAGTIVTVALYGIYVLFYEE